MNSTQRLRPTTASAASGAAFGSTPSVFTKVPRTTPKSSGRTKLQSTNNKIPFDPKDQVDLKYSTYLRSLLLEDVISDENQIIKNIISDSQVCGISKDLYVNEKMQVFMETINEDILEKKKEVEDVDSLGFQEICRNMEVLTNLTEIHHNTNNFEYPALDRLSISNCSNVLEDLKNAISNELGSLNAQDDNNLLGLTVDVLEEEKSVAETFKEVKSEMKTKKELSNLLVKLGSAEEALDEEYAKLMADETPFLDQKRNKSPINMTLTDVNGFETSYLYPNFTNMSKRAGERDLTFSNPSFSTSMAAQHMFKR